jgi:hypothetical protein
MANKLLAQMLHLENLRMAGPDDRRSGRRIPFFRIVASLLVLVVLVPIALQAIKYLGELHFGITETAPRFSSPGPTLVQLERLQYLVSTRVHVTDVLVGESRWLEGCWIIQGDALIGVEMAKAEITNRNETARSAVIVLPQPRVISARVNHEKTQQWDIKSRSWVPMASAVFGDRQAIEKQAMLEAQRLVERVAGSEDHQARARHGVEGTLGELYRGLGWHVSVQWK